MTPAAFLTSPRFTDSLTAIFSGAKVRASAARRGGYAPPHRSIALRPMSQSSNSEGSEAVVEAEKSGGGVLVQYVVLRRDLIDVWPLGSVVMQGCHASVCAIWMSKDDAHTAEYCSAGNIDSMHKVTLEVKGETGCIGHKLWIERTENKLLVWPQSLTLNPQFHHILKS